MLVSLYYSFTRVSIIDPPVFVGFANYVDLFSNPLSLFRKSLSVTLIYSFFNIISSILFAFVVALLLNRKFRGRNLLRAVFYIPSVIPMLATVILWNWLLQPHLGLLNQLLRFIGLPAPNWLMDEKMIYVTLIMMSLWSCGGAIVIFLAALQDVPGELLEAVKVDGGNAWHRFKAVVFPFISPVMFFQILMTLIASFQVFTQSVVLSDNGSPNRATYFANVMIFDEAFKKFRMGTASAAAWVIFAVILVVTGLLFYTSKYWVYTMGGDKKR